MDRVIDTECARELIANHVLWPRVRGFLWDFAPQVHESWLDGIAAADPGVRAALQSSPRFKKHVVDSLAVKPCFHTFPKDDLSRVLLLDGETLGRIAKWLGALACASALRRVTAGAAVRALKAALPGVYPEVFGFEAYFRGMGELRGIAAKWLGVDDAENEIDGEFVVDAGYLILYATVAHLPEPLLHRLRLKMPSHLADKLPSQTLTQPPNLQLLLKLRFLEAYKLCCF